MLPPIEYTTPIAAAAKAALPLNPRSIATAFVLNWVWR
jgi:hypothetical protein